MSFTSEPTAIAENSSRSPSSERVCPLNSGLAILDQLLAAAIRETDPAALDAALDFRISLSDEHEPEQVLRDYFLLRSVVQERHYLACYRLRRWLESRYEAGVKLSRIGNTCVVGVHLTGESFDRLCEHCFALASNGATVAPGARVSFAIRESARSPFA